MPKPLSVKERIKYWQVADLSGVDLLHATYVTQTFSRHTHEGFGVGVIERGALGFYYRGENVVASEGLINLVNPGEVHTGHAATRQGWTYRMFYFDAEVMLAAAQQITGRRQSIPFFAQGVLNDPILAASLRRLHVDLEVGQLSTLEAETRFLRILTQLIQHHALDAPVARHGGCEKQVVKKVCDSIEERYTENLSLNTLAEIAGLSPYHFIRVFQQQTGLTPHAYLMQKRVQRSKTLLQKGERLIDAAYACGFVDQSHFTRHFKKTFGITPGQYRNSVQDS